MRPEHCNYAFVVLHMGVCHIYLRCYFILLVRMYLLSS